MLGSMARPVRVLLSPYESRVLDAAALLAAFGRHVRLKLQQDRRSRRPEWVAELVRPPDAADFARIEELAQQWQAAHGAPEPEDPA